MKKIVCVLLVLVMCMALALAETPSKTVADLDVVMVTSENQAADDFSMSIGYTGANISDEHRNLAYAEIQKFINTNSIEKYFGKNDEIGAIVDTANMNIFEYSPLKVVGYKPEYGKVTAVMNFATPYEAGEKVAVMIGLPDAQNNITWNVLEGVGVASESVEVEGSIQVEFEPELMVAMQECNALVAIISD